MHTAIIARQGNNRNIVKFSMCYILIDIITGNVHLKQMLNKA